jgi:alcohol dehydrogenase class IV
MNAFDFFSVSRISFGRGAFEGIGDLAGSFGQTAMVIANAGQPGDCGLVDRLAELLGGSDVQMHSYRQRGEPSVEHVEQALEVARRESCDVVIGLGGGSAIDAAKAVAGLLTNGGSPLDYMEVIGKGQKLTQPSAPWIAVPTTAGTGAEVTRNAVIGCPEKRFKASLRSEHLLPRIALVDPELGVNVRAEITARSGMDALCQLIESYTSNKAQPITDALAMKGIALAAPALPRAFADGSDLDAREHMAMAALLSGITLANVGLGAVHGFAAPACANYPIPHGSLCAVLLPHVVSANAAALKAEAAEHPCLRKYEAVGRALTGDDDLRGQSAIDAGVSFLADLVVRLEIPGLREFGFQPDGFRDLVDLARKSSSMRYNPIALSDEVLLDILQKAW